MMLPQLFGGHCSPHNYIAKCNSQEKPGEKGDAAGFKTNELNGLDSSCLVPFVFRLPASICQQISRASLAWRDTTPREDGTAGKQSHASRPIRVSDYCCDARSRTPTPSRGDSE